MRGSFTRRAAALLSALWALSACETSDCTLDNTVCLTAAFYSGGQPAAVADTLTVTAAGIDSVLVNRLAGASVLQLPLSYWGAEDTLALTFRGEGGPLGSDTLFVAKETRAHFESPDCPAAMFHRITGARATRHLIDSVTLERADVDYEKRENLRLHLRPAP